MMRIDDGEVPPGTELIFKTRKSLSLTVAPSQMKIRDANNTAAATMASEAIVAAAGEISAMTS